MISADSQFSPLIRPIRPPSPLREKGWKHAALAIKGEGGALRRVRGVRINVYIGMKKGGF
jgi:hypothetical protein